MNRSLKKKINTLGTKIGRLQERLDKKTAELKDQSSKAVRKSSGEYYMVSYKAILLIADKNGYIVIQSTLSKRTPL